MDLFKNKLNEKKQYFEFFIKKKENILCARVVSFLKF